MFTESEKNGDYRGRVYKLGAGSLKEGLIIAGYVKTTGDKGCFIKLAVRTFNAN